MKGFLWGLLIAILLAVLGYGGWYYFLKKSPEDGACRNESTCEQGLNCVNKTCSSGKVGSGCLNYKDCESDLLCTKSVCSEKPDYSKYFSKVTISKMKPGMPPGTDNPLTVTSTFTATDAIEVDFGGVKSSTVGPFYLDFVNSTTGEIARTTNGTMETDFSGQDRGMGTDMGGMEAGEYDLNIYFNGELVYQTSITVE